MTEEQQEYKIVLTPDRVFFYKAESHFGIAACKIAEVNDDADNIKVNRDFGTFTIKGSMPELVEGKKYVAKITPKEDKKYGLGYEVLSIYEKMPTDKEAQKKFLLAVITDKQVDSLYKAYPDTEDMIQFIASDKVDYQKVHGLGDKTYQSLRRKVLENIEYQEAISELCEEYGMTHDLVKKMSDHYGSPTILVQRVKENPYILSDEVNGIGFKKADKIALKNGIDKESDERIGSCMLYCLKQEVSNGHAWVTKKKLINKMSKEINARLKNIKRFVSEPNTQISIRLHIDDNRIGLESSFKAESGIAKHTKRLLSTEDNYHITGVEKLIEESQEKQGFEFTDEQHEAIMMAIKKNVIIINGKAGTGKTSVLKGLIDVLTKGQEGLKYKTCALSGKASQRIQESTGMVSATIHRLLGYQPDEGFTKNESDPLEDDIVVLDEASMVNSNLMNNLMSAIKDGAKLIILGDTEQLEAIGVGNVLKDMIASGTVPTIELTQVHRQAQASGILSIANTVRDGIQFVKKGDYRKRKFGELKDHFFFPKKDSDSVYNDTLKLARRYKGDIMDVQFITPMKNRGKLSTNNLNTELQKIFNPVDDENIKTTPRLKRGEVSYIEGDKVIQNKNNYDKEVFNGTLGIIDHVDMFGKKMIVEFEGIGKKEYEQDELSQIDLAYCLTGHKTQGSQFDNVILAIDYSAYVLLSRQLIYTIKTRAKKRLFTICELDAMIHAVGTDKSTMRNTYLKDLLTA